MTCQKKELYRLTACFNLLTEMAIDN